MLTRAKHEDSTCGSDPLCDVGPLVAVCGEEFRSPLTPSTGPDPLTLILCVSEPEVQVNNYVTNLCYFGVNNSFSKGGEGEKDQEGNLYRNFLFFFYVPL